MDTDHIRVACIKATGRDLPEVVVSEIEALIRRAEKAEAGRDRLLAACESAVEDGQMVSWATHARLVAAVKAAKEG